MNFSEVLEAVKEGNVAYRKAWKTEQSYIELNMTPYLTTENALTGEEKLKTSKLFIHYSDENGICVPWVPTQDDLLSDDWVVITNLATKIRAKGEYENKRVTDNNSSASPGSFSGVLPSIDVKLSQEKDELNNIVNDLMDKLKKLNEAMN